jgi:hypothetical protein
MAFAESLESTSDPLERAIATELWRWSSLSTEDRPEISSPESELAEAIEFYLCDAFQRKNSSPSPGWWCDGVIELSITELGPTNFLIVGAAYWAKTGGKSSPFYIAPFELEFYFDSRADLDAKRTIIRFGELDHFGEIRRIPYDANAWRIVKSRPTTDSEWAFAIELT